MSQQSQTENANYTLTEEVAKALDGKEYFGVALGTADGTVKVATSATDVIGVMQGKMRLGDAAVNVRLLNAEGTIKVKAGGVIAKGARVKCDANGKFVVAGAGDRSIGYKLTQGNSADNDVIEVLVLVEKL